MKLSAIKKSVADGAGVTGQTLIYDSAVSTGSNTYLPVGLYGDSIEGTYAFTTNQDRLYLHTGQGWFQVSTINTNPSFTTGLNASYTLATDATAYKNGTATNIEVLATDPEGFDVTYTATGNTAFNNIAHIERTAGHDSAKGRFFTIEPKTQDSAGSATPADGTLTITASDGINTASTTGTFTLTFDTTITGSEGTTFLSKAIGTGGVNNSFADKSTTGNTHSITASGNVSQGTFSPYSPTGYSWYFPGHSANAGVQTDTNGPTLGTGDLTVEFWFKNDYEFGVTSGTDGTYGYQNLVSDSLYGNGTNNGGWALYQRQDEIRLAVNNNEKLSHHYLPFISTHSEWNHVAWVRNSGTSKIYVNGYDGGVSVSDTVNYPDNKILIGANNTSGQYPRFEYEGWIHDLRIVVGTAVYTGNFTPPNGPLTTTGGDYPSTTNVNTSIDESHTKYRACNLPYINRAKGSTGDAVQTVTGEVETDAFNPYKVQAAYSSSTHGGSAYFDGSGDKLSIAGSSDFDLLAPSGTSNNFTIEMWLYKTVTTGGGDYDGLLYWSTTDRLKFQESDSIINFEIDDTELTIVNGTHNFMNNWAHLAIVREGTSIKTYVNGRLQTTHTNSGAPGGTSTLIIGENSSNVNYGGFITDLRIVKGTAVYTGNFTPPTAPLTEITNTKLLLNMTDAKVIDQGGRQNLVLYGDAQSHSGQPRVSGLSGILFDGNVDAATFSPKKGYIMDGNEDYTVEFYTYYNATPAQTNNINPVFYNATGYGTAATYDEAYIDTAASNVLKYVHSGFVTGDADTTHNNSQSISNTGSFIHVAVVKKDRRIQTFVNGNPGTNLSVAHTEPLGRVDESFLIGAYHSSGGWINSYISEFRITRGQGRYPFLPKKETLTTSTSFQEGITCTAGNVKLLALTTGTVTADASAENHTITNVNTVTTSDFAPKGGMKSGLFVASSNEKLTIPDGAWKTWGSTFTIECWLYANSFPSGLNQNYIWGDYNAAGATNSTSINLLSEDDGTLKLVGTIDSTGVTPLTSTVDMIVKKWYHVAVVRNSNNWYLFLNGVLVDEDTSSTGTINDSSEVFAIGGTGAFVGRQWDGYISNFRVNNSQALYTKNFTPPTTEIKG